MQLNNTFRYFHSKGMYLLKVLTVSPSTLPPSFLKYLSHCSNHTPSQNKLQGVRFICSQLKGCSHYGIVESWWDPQPESRNKCMLLVLRLFLSFLKSSFSPYIWDVAGHCSLFSVTPCWRHPHRHIQRRAGFLYELFLNPVSRMSKSAITFFYSLMLETMCGVRRSLFYK